MVSHTSFIQDVLANGLQKRPSHSNSPFGIRSATLKRFSPRNTDVLGVEAIHRLRNNCIGRMSIFRLCELNELPELIPDERPTLSVSRKFWLDEAPKLIKIPVPLYPGRNK